MAKVIDETGNRYNRWTVLGRAEKRYQHGGGRACWWCGCDCGNVAVVTGDNLRRGQSKSCGCLQKDAVSLTPGKAAFNALVRRMKHIAKKRGYEWQLTDEQVRRLTKQPCYYCGVEPAQIQDIKRSTGIYIYNGLDRIDNERGYILDNVVACCGTCNVAKGAKTLEEFGAWIDCLCQFQQKELGRANSS